LNAPELTPYLYDILSEFKVGPIKRQEGPTDEYKHLVELGYIRVLENEVYPNLSYHAIAWGITPAGRSALSEFEYIRDQQAKQETHQRRQENIGVLQVLTSLLTFTLGLLVEHGFGVVEHTLSLLRALFH
jgi:hypothetical protein